MSTFNLANLIKIVNPNANVDRDYGVWNTTTDAILNVPEAVRKKGKTVGVLEGSKVVEYWWQEGIADTDLVPKGAETDLSDYLTETEINNLLNDYYTKTEVDDLISNIDTNTDLTLQENITAQIAAGNVNIGDLLEQGLSFTDFVKQVYLSTYEPTLIAPAYSLSSSITGVREIGDSTNITLTGNFNRGKIKGDIVSGTWNPNALQDFRAGTAIEYTFNGVVESTNTKTIPHTVVSGTNSFTSTVDYQAGVQPLDSDGNNFSSPLPSGTLSATNNQLTGRYRQFYGAVADFPTNSTEVRQLSSNFTNTNSFLININTTKFSIILPPGRNIVSVITANNENITANFTSNSIDVNDAGGNSVTYTAHNFESALPLNVTATVILN